MIVEKMKREVEMNDPKYSPVGKVARVMGIPAQLLKTMIASGKIGPEQGATILGRRVFLDQGRFQDWLASGGTRDGGSDERPQK